MKSSFKDISYTHQLVLLVILVLVSWGLLTIMGTIIAIPIWGMDSLSNPNILLNNQSFLKYFQVIQSFALFIIPPFLFKYLVEKFPSTTRNKHPQIILLIFLSALVVVLAQPFVSITGIINNNLSFPDSLQYIEDWMRGKEDSAQRATEIFLSYSHWSESILNICIIAILPAIGEELLFRGTIQPILMGIFKRKHLAIIITAALFSAIHIQFFGFLPRFILGVIFGYLMLYGKNIWLPISAHFINNFMAFMMYQVYLSDADNENNPLNVSEEYPSPIWITLSIIGVILILKYIKKRTVLT
ncbi:CPBP family intramembrane glutamic endopeptidase [Labilibacter marinus]|uniref:CPBP family intramembrane glutamic endopeptidase n=1 Tax=Labilibacter marinus TaxID=1477105 RepID=UPI00094F59CF|nr:type II CAAX endopeptidase family protein [Labilibacter marinus]